MNNKIFEAIKNEYDMKSKLYESLLEKTKEQVKVLLDSNKIVLFTPMENRIKAWSSLEKKYLLENKLIESFEDITDLAGLRIIVLFEQDIEKVCEIIRNNFCISKEEDKSADLSENKFGYQSIHFDAKLKENWCQIPIFNQGNDFKLEIQVRTASQHIWASTSHHLQYKNEEDIPLPLKRSMNRISALLEIIDLEVNRILTEQYNYINEISSKNNFSDTKLNVDTLRLIIEKSWPQGSPANYNNNDYYSELLALLFEYGIKNESDLMSMIESQYESTLEFDQKMMESHYKNIDASIERPRVFMTPIGLTRAALLSTDRPKFNFSVR